MVSMMPGVEVWNIYPSCFPVSLRKGHSVQLNLDAKTVGKRPKQNYMLFSSFERRKRNLTFLLSSFSQFSQIFTTINFSQSLVMFLHFSQLFFLYFLMFLCQKFQNLHRLLKFISTFMPVGRRHCH